MAVAPKLIRRKTATAQGYTVDDAPASNGTWQFRIRERGGKRRVVYRIFVSAEVRRLIRAGNYEQWKKDVITDFSQLARSEVDAYQRSAAAN